MLEENNMLRTRRVLVPILGALLFIMISLAGSAPALAEPALSSPINSSTGSHIANALSLSHKAFPSGAPAAVLCNINSYSDSLTAAVLAGVCKGPLLPTSSPALTADVATELKRLKPALIYIVGLPGDIAHQVRTALQVVAPKVQIVSIVGADRYQTARLVAGEIKAKLGSVSGVVIAPGDGYAGALAATALAAAKGWPIILTPAAGPFAPAAKAAIEELGVKTGIAIGTDVDPGVSGFTVTKKIIGASSSGDTDGRYDACYKLAEYAVSKGWASYDRVGLVPGTDFPDGAVLAPYLARYKGILLLSTPASLPGPTIAAMKARAAQIHTVDFVGLGWAVYREVKSLNSPRITGLSTPTGPVAGGNSLTVTGSALNGVTEVRVGKVVLPASGWRIDSGTQLTISSVPAAGGACPVEVGVTNFWGKSPAGTKDVYAYADDGSAWMGDKVVREALKYVGTPYTWAGASPSSGFDCSGFAMYVYGKLGITLPHYSRSQATYGTPVNKADLKPGDLIFFYTPISHVGIYVGGGMMINAPRSGDLVTIENAFRTSYVTARRIMSPYERYQQNDPGLVYSGTWTADSSAAAASGGSFRYANTSGASVTVKFTGTSFIWLNKKSPVYGIASVVVDDGPAVQVDLFSATEVWQQKVWQSATLSAGTHTVTISWTGAKNSAATNTNIGVDAFDILGTVGQAPVTTTTLAPTTTTTTAPVTTTTTLPVTTTTAVTPGTTTTTTAKPATVKRYEQADANLLYQGAWTAAPSQSASGGSYRYANTSGASVTVRFTGTSFAWVTKKNPKYGIARLTLDGGTPTIVDLYSATEVWQQTVWKSADLEQGTHTVKIERTGTKNPLAVDYNIGTDAFDIAGTLGQAPPTTTITLAPTTTTTTVAPTTTTTPVATTTTTVPGTTTTTTAKTPVVKRFEQGDANLLYLGVWSTNSAAPSASGGSFRYANTSGASVTIRFTGTSFAWITKKSPVYGKARLTLDGGTPIIVDLYNAKDVWKQKVWQNTSLKQGTHTVKIEWTGTKNPSATGCNIGADAFDVAGTLEPVCAGLVVVIDPGHQAKSDLNLEAVGPGSTDKKAKVSAGARGVVTGTPESQLVLAVSLKLRDALEAQGITVIMTRTTQNVNISNMQRALMANQAGADLLIRVHADAYSKSAVSGAHVLYPAAIAGWTDDIAVASKNAATLILKELVAATGATNRGLMVRSDMTGFNWSDVPVIIPEIGFMTNPAEDRLLATAAYQDKVVQGLTRGILAFLVAQ
jgi:N-acetylmuramoyl-L-alanine amidase